MTVKTQNKDQPMFQLCAYKNTISGNIFDNTKQKDNIDTIEFHNLVANIEEEKKLAEEL